MTQYLLSVWHDDDLRGRLQSADAQRIVRPGRRLQRRAPGRRRLGVRRRSAPSRVGHRGPLDGRRGLDDRRPLRRVQGADGRLLGHRGRRPRRRPRLGRAGPRPPARARSRSARSRVSDDLDAVFRREAGRCTATLIRVLGDIDLAEDAVAEAFAIAAERWPVDGCAAEPRRLDHHHGPQPGHRPAAPGVDPHRPPPRRPPTPRDARHGTRRRPDLDDLDAFVDVVADDQLRLMFLCCHPALAPDAQVALTLRLLGGLETPEIARAFLVPEATMAQRIVRAKRKLRDNHAPYRIPPRRRAARPPPRRARRDLPDLHRGPHRHRRATSSSASTCPTRRSASVGCSSS